MPLIVEDLAKRYGPTAALHDVSLTVDDGAFLALLGPSGSGKTTLLRILAGLAQPSSGAVRYAGEDFLALSPRERRAGMVFQHYALFRHMSVAANIGFGLSARPRAQRPSRARIAARVEELLALVQLEGMGGRYPGQLSGGQQQRVALARALAIEPRLLLLDEPFGALDAKVRRDLRRWLRRVHDETGVTTVFVTHDQDEALDLADQVAILSDGRIVQTGSPAEVYERPASPFVFDFLGAANRLEGEVRAGELRLLGARLPAPGRPDGPVQVYFRPHDVAVDPPGGGGFAARLDTAVVRGPAVRLECSAGGQAIELELAADQVRGLSRGQDVRLEPRKFALFPRG
ncbi:sulfate/molybdate ABC transporter ATP-binding protein [Phenylobacterium sp.]|uniref:sulfate/molybdate ABC transporter ATP-binding protein n=1 Tax=Phenylobacterium sp. TaxID=1871053 RepID=UPI0035B3247D